VASWDPRAGRRRTRSGTTLRRLPGGGADGETSTPGWRREALPTAEPASRPDRPHGEPTRGRCATIRSRALVRGSVASSSQSSARSRYAVSPQTRVTARSRDLRPTRLSISATRADGLDASWAVFRPPGRRADAGEDPPRRELAERGRGGPTEALSPELARESYRNATKNAATATITRPPRTATSGDVVMSTSCRTGRTRGSARGHRRVSAAIPARSRTKVTSIRWR
jgi:hypothetical protein